MFVINLLKHTNKDLVQYQEIVKKVNAAQRSKLIHPSGTNAAAVENESKKGDEIDLNSIEMPEAVVFVSCCGYILQPHQSLRFVKELIWRKNAENKSSHYLTLHYSLRN
jgi:hypothetical protein